MQLKGSQTETNLREAFALEAQATQRLLYFARIADIEGRAQVASLLRSLADGETGHSLGTVELLADAGDPDSGLPIGGTVENLRVLIAGQEREAGTLFPEYAATARKEGFLEAAEWFDTLAQADAVHLETLRRAAEHLGEG